MFDVTHRKNSNRNFFKKLILYTNSILTLYDDVIKGKHIPRYWPFVQGIHRSTVNSPHKGQWREALMFSLICAHYDVIVITSFNVETIVVQGGMCCHPNGQWFSVGLSNGLDREGDNPLPEPCWHISLTHIRFDWPQCIVLNIFWIIK